MIKKFKRVLVANRGEIAIRIFRACAELGIRTVAIYSNEDNCALFRSKADESYLIGKNKKPVDAYLGIDEIISLAQKKGVDAIHPGYGFLSENPEFVRKCAENGIAFIGPTAEMMDQLGDKIKSKLVAQAVGVPTIPGVEKPISSEAQALEFAAFCGYPVMLKAAAGGGGRGMRVVSQESELLAAFRSARSEAKKAFGSDDIFVEKYLTRPKHIEVQVLGDNDGNIVHLFERDCSIQRRHQKVIEFAPALTLSPELRQSICDDALKIARAVSYRSAGTLEFLVDAGGSHYFIEMNPRIQVEHTVTEMITGIDLVQAQLLIAQGYPLSSRQINIRGQEDIQTKGYAIQCRVTTEDPGNQFSPETGIIDVYRSGSGFGIRLDGAEGRAGANITPYYDSLLVKITAHSRAFDDARMKAIRSIRELTVSGVKTNVDFLINVLNHPKFREGSCDTGFINNHPELFNIEPKSDDELKILRYLGNKVVNETKGQKREFDVPHVPQVDTSEPLYGTKQIFDSTGPDGLVSWIKSQNKLLLTDNTMRDAHQSLMATRLRTRDMLKIAKATSVMAGELFSLEMWGGATFDVAYRYLNESPWERLEELRRRIPNILFQMLIRGANTVGYKNYPDNVVHKFIRESAASGIDIFRIFDSLNWLKGMEVAVDAVRQNNCLAEACICYTGDILDEKRDKYSLDYYVQKAKAIEQMGAHILGIKDMSALLKPYAAHKLVRALKEEISLPIHLHTHDTSGNGVATLLMAAEAGVDIVDTAFNSMSGLTSQPALNSVVAAMKNTDRDPGFDLNALQQLSDYWEAVRPVYGQFESELKSATAEIYQHEMPGGQYSNLKPQVESFGLGHQFREIKEMYSTVNQMVGDIVKVTPSSKMVGDMAIFMVRNGLTPENIYEKGRDLSFPDSVVDYFKGMMGQPEGGFPPALQQLVLKGETPITCRPGEILPPEDFAALGSHLHQLLERTPSQQEILSYALYPKVFEEYIASLGEYGNLSRMGSDVFFHGLSEGETCEVEIAEGQTLVIKLLQISPVNLSGCRAVVFEVNGNRREVQIADTACVVRTETVQTVMADPGNPGEVGASIPGTVIAVLVKEGEQVAENQVLAVIEAMKMETNVNAPKAGTVSSLLVKEGQKVVSGELIARLS